MLNRRVLHVYDYGNDMLGSCALQAYRQESQKNPAFVHFLFLNTQPDSVRFSVVGAANAQLSHEPWTVTFHIFIDPGEMALRLKLDFGQLNFCMYCNCLMIRWIFVELFRQILVMKYICCDCSRSRRAAGRGSARRGAVL